jgi:hypothetical protein
MQVFTASTRNGITAVATSVALVVASFSGIIEFTIMVFDPKIDGVIKTVLFVFLYVVIFDGIIRTLLQANAESQITADYIVADAIIFASSQDYPIEIVAYVIAHDCISI